MEHIDLEVFIEEDMEDYINHERLSVIEQEGRLPKSLDELEWATDGYEEN